MCKGIIKRAFDMLLSLFLIIIFSPLIILLMALIRVFSGSPVFFAQMRPGLNGKPFMLYKFRTMTDTNDSNGYILPDIHRITPLGLFLRRTSLDELPELWNVIKGDMSLVGPRPLLMQYLDRYSPVQMRRHEIKPGITGWAQVNGRNAISWDDKFRFDVWYVDNRSLLLDIKIICITIWKILKQEGISQQGEATAKEFVGSYNNEKKDGCL